MINNLSPTHQGEMPIRVLQHNLIHAFENMTPEFLELSKKIIADQGLDNGIGYGFDEEPVKCPRVIFNKIFVEEPFLSYVWCIAFSLTVLYEEVIVKKSKNDYFGNQKEVTNMSLSKNAYQLWEYAIRLLSQYENWNMGLPNPERYDEQYEDLILKVNGLYLTAMQFVLAHEFAHIELKHNERFNDTNDENTQNAEFEKEADSRSIELNLQGVNEINRMTIHMGLLIGLCSLLFFSSVIKGNAYPDTDDRIDAILRNINPDEQDAMWGIATLAYKLWDRQYGIGLEWKENLASPKAQYEDIKRQIDIRNLLK